MHPTGAQVFGQELGQVPATGTGTGTGGGGGM